MSDSVFFVGSARTSMIVSERESGARRRVGALARVVADDERRGGLATASRSGAGSCPSTRRSRPSCARRSRRASRGCRGRARRRSPEATTRIASMIQPKTRPTRPPRRARRRRRLPVPAHRLEHRGREHRAAVAVQGRSATHASLQRRPHAEKGAPPGARGHLTEVPGRGSAALGRYARRGQPRARTRGSAGASARPRRTAGPCAPRSPRPGRGRRGRRRSTAPAGARGRCR